MKTPLAIGACVREEQMAYGYLKATWPFLPPARQAAAAESAERQARHGRYMYYQTLANFVRREVVLEQQARDRAAPPRFERW